MATLEERVQALEREHEQLQTLKREHTELKKTIELQTIAIRALVAKEAFEKLQETVERIQETVETSQEQNGKLFNVLINHNTITNERLVDLQNQIIELDNKLDGKIAGQQTEIRQGFNKQDSKIAVLQATQTEHTTLLQEHTVLLREILKRLPER